MNPFGFTSILTKSKGKSATRNRGSDYNRYPNKISKMRAVWGFPLYTARWFFQYGFVYPTVGRGLAPAVNLHRALRRGKKRPYAGNAFALQLFPKFFRGLPAEFFKHLCKIIHIVNAAMLGDGLHL